jgi:hypothetical protein
MSRVEKLRSAAKLRWCHIGPLADRGGSGHKAAQVISNIQGLVSERHMPSLIRFLVVIGVLGGGVFGGLYALAHYGEPEQKEVVTSVPGVKVRR